MIPVKSISINNGDVSQKMDNRRFRREISEMCLIVME